MVPPMWMATKIPFLIGESIIKERTPTIPHKQAPITMKIEAAAMIPMTE